MTQHDEKPSLRWGIIGTGRISSMFIKDLLLDRSDALANHPIVAIGSSSLSKGKNFVDRIWSSSEVSRSSKPPPPQRPTVHHKEHCLDAITAGKHVLCEKPFTITAKDALVVIEAARAKGVFLMEALWTRFFPLVSTLHRILHVERRIGDLHRVLCDFGSYMPMDSLPADSRLKDPRLGAGALLDIGIYCLTWASLILDEGKVGNDASSSPVEVLSTMTIVDDIDIADVVVLTYPTNHQRAILTTTLQHKSPDNFCRIEGSLGRITLFGESGSIPAGMKIRMNDQSRDKEEIMVFPILGTGLYWEADAVALDIAAGRKENAKMPLAETMRMMKLMDRIRGDNGLLYPQDR